ncbi:MAG: site-specific integrase [Clostridiaceae bacterium]|nr:site-specific integrase [Clostridiaceae bacterium]
MARPKKEKPNHSSGMYEVKVTIGHNFDGTPIRKSFYSSKSKAAARLKAEEYKINQAVYEATGEHLVPNAMSFEKWAKEFLESIKGTIKDSSYNLTYKNSLDNHLIPYFGKRKLTAIKQIDIQTYFNKKSKILALETLKKHKMTLNRMFQSAIINEICDRNPCQNIKLSSTKKPLEKRTYTADEVELVLEYTKAHRFGLAVYLMLMYGLSRSELLGLMWSDVDFENKVIYINRGVADVQDPATKKMKIVIGDLKNEFRKRDIPLSNDTIQFLKSKANNSDFIICNTKGNVCSPRTWSRRHFDVFMKEMSEYYLKKKEIEVPMLNPHELRHTRATLWVNDDLNLFAVANVLGHSDLKMLRKRYAHSDVESTRKMLKID